MATHFTASQDRVTWTATVVVIIAILGSAAALAIAAWNSPASPVRVLIFALAALEIVLLLVLAAFVPLGYRVQETGVCVERRVRPVWIPLGRIRQVRQIELHRVIRALGVGGFFGAWGWFTSRELPSFRAYVTRRRGLVCLDLHEGLPIVLSPDAPETFVQEVRHLLEPLRLERSE